MRISKLYEYSDEDYLTQDDLNRLDKFADREFAEFGIDVQFTRHFLDRVNDERNRRQITAAELEELFQKEADNWGKPIAQMGPGQDGVMKDRSSKINLPFALNWDGKKLKLVAKTVMRKPNFKTTSKEFPVESVENSLDAITPTIDELIDKYEVSISILNRQIKKGIDVEMEHTSDPKVALEIALDHINEDLFYYEKLAKVEEGSDPFAASRSQAVNRARRLDVERQAIILDRIGKAKTMDDMEKIHTELDNIREDVAGPVKMLKKGAAAMLGGKNYKIALDMLHKAVSKVKSRGKPRHSIEYYADMIARQFAEGHINRNKLVNLYVKKYGEITEDKDASVPKTQTDIGFDPKTIEALSYLRVKYPQAENVIAALIADIEDSQSISLKNDIKHDIDIKSLDKKVGDIEKKIKSFKGESKSNVGKVVNEISPDKLKKAAAAADADWNNEFEKGVSNIGKDASEIEASRKKMDKRRKQGLKFRHKAADKEFAKKEVTEGVDDKVPAPVQKLLSDLFFIHWQSNGRVEDQGHFIVFKMGGAGSAADVFDRAQELGYETKDSSIVVDGMEISVRDGMSNNNEVNFAWKPQVEEASLRSVMAKPASKKKNRGGADSFRRGQADSSNGKGGDKSNYRKESVNESTEYREGDRVTDIRTGERGVVQHKGNRNEYLVKFGTIRKFVNASALRLVDESINEAIKIGDTITYTTRQGKKASGVVAKKSTNSPQGYFLKDGTFVSKQQVVSEAHGNDSMYDKCWDGYRKVPGKKRGEKGSCKKIGECVNETDELEITLEGDVMCEFDDSLLEAEYQGRKVELNKPMQGDVKKFKVYVKNDKGNVVKVNFGDPDMKIKKSNPERRKSFRARHNCDNPGPKWKARYWSCRAW